MRTINQLQRETDGVELGGWSSPQALDRQDIQKAKDIQIQELEELYQECTNAIIAGMDIHGQQYLIATNNLLTIKEIARKAIEK